MQNVLSLQRPLTSIFQTAPEILFIKNASLIILGSFLIAIFAQIQIPLQPIPVTLQDFGVLLVGMILGWRSGTWAVLLYLIEGAAGFPVFAHHSGLAELFGPLSGYLFGFLPAAFLSGLLIQRGWGRSLVTTALATVVGFTVIFAAGIGVLSTYVGFNHAVEVGFYPFLLTDGLKLLFLTTLTPFFWKPQASKRS